MLFTHTQHHDETTHDTAVSITVISQDKGKFPLPDIAVCLGPRRGCGNGATAQSCITAGHGIMRLDEGFTTQTASESLLMTKEVVRFHANLLLTAAISVYHSCCLCLTSVYTCTS
jgi:hypothetical protein